MVTRKILVATPKMQRARTSAGDAASPMPPAFVGKLFDIVNNPETQDLITWGANGDSIVVRDKDAFATRVLPLYFNHKNVCSFVRQLHIYGFTKVGESTEAFEFRNDNFRRDDPSLMKKIIRRKPEKRLASADDDDPKSRHNNGHSPNSTSAEVDEEIADLRHEVQRLNSLVASMSSEMASMRTEHGKLVQGLCVALAQIGELKRQALQVDVKPDIKLDSSLSTGVPLVDAFYHSAHPHVALQPKPQSHEQVWQTIAEAQGLDDNAVAASFSVDHAMQIEQILESANGGDVPGGVQVPWEGVAARNMDTFVSMFQNIGTPSSS